MAVICASAPALKAYFKDAPPLSRYSPWPSDYTFSRTGSSASSKRFLDGKKSVPVVTDEKLLGSYFNTTGGDQGDRVWFQSLEARDMKPLERMRDPRGLNKSLPRPPSYDDIDDVYQGRAWGFGNEVRIQGPGRAF